MRSVLIAALVATSLSASAARAEPPGLVIPVPMEQPIGVVAQPLAELPAPETSYRWQVVGADAVAIGSLAIAFQGESRDWANLSLATYALGAPIIHAVNGHGGRALGSLGLRVGLPLLAGFIGAGFDQRQVCAAAGATQPAIVGPGGPIDVSCGDTFPGDGLAKGVAIGAVAAMALDAWLVAKPEKRARRMWSPNASAAHGGLSVGVAGAF